MEFLLINHPLDCPICDQAGECRLQEFSVEYGNAESRFLENKVKKPKNVELGPRVTLDDERCILCSRCIRFCQEIVHDDVLGFVDRGSHSVLTAHPGKRLENNYSLNTVDICPVGALTSSDFRFQMRVWFLKETKSFCTSCATGCNTIIGTREDVIYRQTPRENNAVNSSWMCDYGRLNFGYLQSDKRLLQPEILSGDKLDRGGVERRHHPRGSAVEAFFRLGDRDSRLRPNDERRALADVATREDTWRRFDRHRSAHRSRRRHSFERRSQSEHKWRATPWRDARNPGARLREIVDGVASGPDQSADRSRRKPDRDRPDRLPRSNRLPAFVVMNILSNEATQAATAVLPSFGFAEKRGSMINGKGRLQRLNRAVRGPGQARDDWEILRDLIQACSGRNSETESRNGGLHSIEDVFRQMSESIPQFAGLSLSKIGDLGVQVMNRSRKWTIAVR